MNKSMNNPNRTHMKLTERGQKVKAGLAMAAFIGASVGAVVAIEHGKNDARHAQRVEALNAIDTPVFRSILLKSGTELRLTPKELNGSNDVDNDNNAGSVPVGKDWIVQAPLVDLENPGWIAITRPGAENQIHSLGERADETVWVHYGAVNPVKGGMLDWKFGEDGVAIVNGDMNLVIGSSMEVDENSQAVVESLLNTK